MFEIFNLQNVCRCCHRDGIFKSLELSYVHDSCIEVYSDMMRETFGVAISLPPLEASFAICDHCILKLRDASRFKKLVLVNEQKFEEYCKNEQYDRKLEDDKDIDTNIGQELYTKIKNEAEPADITTSIEHEPKYNIELTVTEKSGNIEANIEKTSRSKQSKLEPDFETLLKTEDGNICYRCKICGQDYNSLKSLRRHITLQHRGAYKCSTCRIVCSNREKYLAHVKLHSAPPETCRICQRTFTKKRDLTKHMIQHTKQKSFQCDLCQKLFGYKQSLRRHVKWHYGVKSCEFMCELCGQAFSDVTNMNIHIQTVHEKLRPFECSVCPKTFTRKRHLDAHMNGHTGEWPVRCDECRKGFSCTWKLKQHKLRHHEFDIDGNKHERKRGYDCKICQQVFETRGKLLTHTRSHVGVEVKVFKCHTCGKEFMNKYTLKRHVDKHNGVQAFGCKVCRKRFTLKYQLIKHNFDMHHPNSSVGSSSAKVKCNVCNRHYVDMDKHLESHRTRPFACELCTKCYPDKSALNRHVKCVHFKPRPFACGRCDENYSKIRHLKLHTTKIHKIMLKYKRENVS